MPIFMDRHFAQNATSQALADAHEKDLDVQDKFNVKFLTYWFDEKRSTAFCLVDAPDKQSLQDAHNEAHGNIAHEIIEVDPIIVESFLGRIKDPTPNDNNGKVEIDSAFRVIMFTDLKDSTEMTTRYGDSIALNLIHIHNVLTRNQLREFNGNEIKHTGDGIMASFISVEDAVNCAIQIQKAFIKHNETSPKEQLYLKIGLSAGEPIEEHGDLFGQSVQLSARLCAHAKPNQILISSDVKKLIEEPIDLNYLEDVKPKGFKEYIPIFEVLWGNSLNK